MRSAVLYAPRRLILEERVVPEPARGEVRVRVAVVGICGSDLHFYDSGRSGSCVVEGPFVMGHEFSGIVDSVGTDVDPARIGERVSVEPGIACGVCKQCRADRYNHCPSMIFLGAYPTDGGLQEYVCVPAGQVFAVPDGVSLTAAALVEPLSVAMHAVRRAELKDGARLLVTGAGPIGLLVADVARTLHGAQVTVIDLDPVRRAVAARRGSAVDVELEDGSADALVECTGAITALTTHLAAVRRAGTVVVVGVGARELLLPMDAVQEGELTLRGSHRYAGTWPSAIDLIARGEVDVVSLVTTRCHLDRLMDVLAGPGPDDIKTVVDVAARVGSS